MILAALLLTAAAAAPPVDCRHAATQVDMTQCAARDAQRADAALNRQWTTTLRFMKQQDGQAPAGSARPGYAAALLQSQRTWLAYRDAQCTIEGYAMRGGSAEPMVRAGCIAALTDARTRQLRGLIWSR